MGAIYRVRHRLLNEVRVMKVMKPQMSQSEELRRRFLREAQTVTRLKHPNIVTVHDLIVDEDGTAYMIMEYIEGISLSELILRSGRVPHPIAFHLSRQCLSALGHLHRKGIVHRDVSPDNIMVARDDGEIRAKLIDLGIAKVARAEENLTATDQFLGKLLYASPEQLTKSSGSPEIDGRSDLYSFGIVLCELLTGGRLVGEGSIHAVISAHMSGHAARLQEIAAADLISARIQATLVKALAPKPENRFQSAELFSAALDDLAFPQPGQQELNQIERYLSNPADSSNLGSEEETTSEDHEKTVPANSGTREDTLRLREPTIGSTGSPAAGIRKSRTAWLALSLPLVALGAYALWRIGSPREPSSTSPPPTGGMEQRVSQPLPRPAPSVPPASPPASAGNVVPISASSDNSPKRPSSPPASRKTELEVPKSVKTRVPAPVGSGKIPVSPAVLPASAAPASFCAEVDPTSYVQGVLKESAEGFASDSGQSFRAPRTDAARIQIRISLAPTQPHEGEPFVVTARLINGGDSDLDVERVEESAPGTAGGYLLVAGTRIPATLNIGGSIEIFRSQAVLREGGSYFKSLRITDADGDAWKSSVRLAVCPQL